MYLELEFVRYSEALALRELGFNEPCFGYYTGDKKHLLIRPNMGRRNEDLNDVVCTAPLYQQAFQFLLDKLKVVSITYFNDGSGNLKRMGEGMFFDFNNRKECLIELINLVKLKK